MVVGCQIWSETRVQGGSSGGSTYVGPGGGHVSTPAVTISSTTAEKLQLFIREDDGTEFDQRFVNAGVGLREGNRVSIIYVPDEHGEPLALVNQTTGKSRIYENRIGGLLGKQPINPVLGPIVGVVSFLYMLALLPLFGLFIYLGLTGRLSFLGWVGCNVLMLAMLPILGLLGPKTPAGLKAAVTEALNQRVNEALTSEKGLGVQG